MIQQEKNQHAFNGISNATIGENIVITSPFSFQVFLCLAVMVAAAAADATADRPHPHPPHPSPPKYPPPPPPKYHPAPPASHPKTDYHIPDRNCSVDFEKSVAELCVPTLKTACGTEDITFKEPVEEEKCIDIPMVHCKAEVRLDNNLKIDKCWKLTLKILGYFLAHFRYC